MFDALSPQLRGGLLLPDSSMYDDARSIWNGMIDKRPAAIARCLGVGDVVAAVNFARTNNVSISIKGGGHNIAGLAVGEGSLMLDMSAMRGVWVDPVTRIAHAQPGCLLGDVDRETQLHGLAAVLGFVSNTGIAGLTLGGGFGYLSRRYGWTSDNVRSITLVTADGKIVRASEKENADLFWGLRGGGGNFGVVVDFEYELYPVGPEIVAGAIVWAGDDIPGAMKLIQEVTNDTPVEAACPFAARIAPPAPWIAPEAHGKPVVMMIVCHTGSIADGEEFAARIKSFGKPVGDVITRRPYSVQQSLLDATQPKGRRYYWKSEYVSSLNDALIEDMVRRGHDVRSPHSAILGFQLGGAIGDRPTDHSAVGNRDANFVVNIAAAWDDPADDDANIAWAREGWEALRPYSTGGTYINFLTEEDASDRIHDAYGANYDRLAELKSKWDPNNLFHENKNIAPVAL